ncbi:hypothetical protein M405DRAFT_844701 [Rhizopogon salebrosus TDB-379]|nr:hypothetical protein M405DRAFT_844701 [Rhizopogon salebrosus TDB-379]
MLPNGSYKINNVAFPAQYVDMASDGTTVTGYHEDKTATGENHRTFMVTNTDGGLVTFFNSTSSTYLTANNQKGVVEGGTNPQQFYLANLGERKFTIKLPNSDIEWVLKNGDDGAQVCLHWATVFLALRLMPLEVGVASYSGDDRGYWRNRVISLTRLSNGRYKINNVAFSDQYVDMASDGITVTGYHEDNTAAGETHRTFTVTNTDGLVTFFNSTSGTYLTANSQRGVVEGGTNSQEFYLVDSGEGKFTIRLLDSSTVWVLNDPSDGSQISVTQDSGDDNGYWRLIRA